MLDKKAYQVVILAAGMGKRLKNKTKNHTKSMVEFLGKTFLEHSLDKLTKFNISRIIIVIGYCGDEIKNIIGNEYNGIPIVYVTNEIYAITNNIYSLYLTKDYLVQQDTLLLESDLIYEEKIIGKLLDAPETNLVVVSKYKSYMDGTVVKIDDKNRIVALISKEHFDYKEIDTYYKTVNIYKFSKEFLKNDYIPFLEAYCKAMGNNSYYEQVLKILLSLEKNNLHVLKLESEKWYEVDDLQDYDIAETLFSEDPAFKLDKYQKSYGGYWRFDKLKDFCYLVNPYFPTSRMVYEMQNSFLELLTNYPSGQNVQKLLVSNIWNLKTEQVLIGNGASELINALLRDIKGKVGVILPTFEEYPHKVSNDAEVVYFTPPSQPKGFRYCANDLIDFASKIDTLILINPDNPSGNFIKKSNLFNLLDYYKTHNKTIILDESFVDFSEETESNSLLESEILEKYKNLIVVKSISKSYGVPGIRLGILASANEDMISKCAKNLSIWNINSYGEFFLQILNKYRKNYKVACEKIVENRNMFFEQLKSIEWLNPIESQANYILCEVLSPYTSEGVCNLLLKYNILVKNCENKLGFNGEQYIRIAVKSCEDNNELIEILRKNKVQA